jgi:hypothetical protein
MNGRLYDPIVGRMLSPDNFIQAAGFTQNYNRYSYVLNNPLKYTDPDGNNPLLAAFMMGGLMNTYSQGNQGNIHNFGQGLLAFGIGGLSGLSGAFVGGAIFNSLSFTGFAGGFLTGVGGGFVSGFMLSSGNAWMNGSNFGDGLRSGIKGGGLGSLIGGITNGLYQGFSASQEGYDFWDGSRYEEFSISPLQQIDDLGINRAKAYDASQKCIDESDFTKTMYAAYHGVEEGDYGIQSISTKAGKNYGLTENGVYVNLSKKSYALGYTKQHYMKYASDIHISPYAVRTVNFGSQAVPWKFLNVSGHELIHAYHIYKLGPLYVGRYSEIVAYQYSTSMHIQYEGINGLFFGYSVPFSGAYLHDYRLGLVNFFNY